MVVQDDQSVKKSKQILYICDIPRLDCRSICRKFIFELKKHWLFPATPQNCECSIKPYLWDLGIALSRGQFVVQLQQGGHARRFGVCWAVHPSSTWKNMVSSMSMPDWWIPSWIVPSLYINRGVTISFMLLRYSTYSPHGPQMNRSTTKTEFRAELSPGRWQKLCWRAMRKIVRRRPFIADDFERPRDELGADANILQNPTNMSWYCSIGCFESLV